MELKKILAFFTLALLIGAAYFFYPKQKKVPAHFHAGFYVYSDGALLDFSRSEYMHTTYCELDSAVKNSIDTSHERAHLHNNVGDVVHIHQEGAKWIDLFNSIDYHFPNDKSVRGFKDGHEVVNILQTDVKPYDSVIIAIGETKNIDLSRYVSKAHIKDVESKSEYCGKN